MTIKEKLTQLGVILPPPPKAVGAYVPALQIDKTVYVSGQLPIVDGQLKFTGKVPADTALADAQQAAKICALNALAALDGLLDSLDNITRIIRVEVFVNSSSGFTQQAQVANGASEFICELFKDVGLHTRIAVGVAELPLDAAVEISMICQVSK